MPLTFNVKSIKVSRALRLLKTWLTNFSPFQELPLSMCGSYFFCWGELAFQKHGPDSLFRLRRALQEFPRLEMLVYQKIARPRESPRKNLRGRKWMLGFHRGKDRKGISCDGLCSTRRANTSRPSSIIFGIHRRHTGRLPIRSHVRKQSLHESVASGAEDRENTQAETLYHCMSARPSIR
jgi:hypothetical protein